MEITPGTIANNEFIGQDLTNQFTTESTTTNNVLITQDYATNKFTTEFIKGELITQDLAIK